MSYFDKYVSNTLAPTGNQTFFISDGTAQKSRAFYKILKGGCYEYSFLFSNIIDSTFADGSISKANDLCDPYTIHSAKILVVGKYETFLECPRIIKEIPLKFDGNTTKEVISGEIFYSDPVKIMCNDEDYFVLEMEFSGTKLPYFEEATIPTFRFIDGRWVSDKRAINTAMVGVQRQVEKRIGFLGDSITQGIGTENNSYDQWNAKIASLTRNNYSYWNLGIGFARGADAATDGVWLSKAKNLDVCTVCFGVNDTGAGYTAEEIKANIAKIISILQENKVRTILFTVPPFDLEGERCIKWYEVNRFIREEMSKITEIFDVVPILGKDKPNEHMAKYGGHPDEEGCLKLAIGFCLMIDL